MLERTWAGSSTATQPLLGRKTDFFLLGLGATLVLPVIVWLAARAASPLTIWIALTLVVAPHYAATYRRAYRSIEAIRATLSVTVIAPLTLIVASAVAIRSPQGFAPWFYLTYVVFSGYHYSRQSLGIALVYFMRQGHPLDRNERMLFALPLYATWALWLAGVLRPVVNGGPDLFTTVRDAFPRLAVHAPLLVTCGAITLASWGAVVVLAVKRRRLGAPIPPQCLSVLAAQTVWFSVALFHPLFAAVTVPLLHSVQYLGFTTWHHAETHPARTRRRVLVVYAVMLIAMGLILREALPRTLMTLGLQPLLVGGVVTTFVNLHHFMLDARIWQLRDPAVANTVLGVARANAA